MEGGRVYPRSEIMARKPVVWLDVELARQRYRTLIRERKQ
jgi:hypothetical protein